MSNYQQRLTFSNKEKEALKQERENSDQDFQSWEEFYLKKAGVKVGRGSEK